MNYAFTIKYRSKFQPVKLQSNIFERIRNYQKESHSIFFRSFSFVTRFLPKRPLRNRKKQELRQKRKLIRLKKWIKNQNRIASYKRILFAKLYGATARLKTNLIKLRIRARRFGRKKKTVEKKFLVKRLVIGLSRVKTRKTNKKLIPLKKGRGRRRRWSFKLPVKSNGKLRSQRDAIHLQFWKQAGSQLFRKSKERWWNFLPYWKRSKKQVEKEEVTDLVDESVFVERKPTFNSQYCRLESLFQRPWKFRRIRWRKFERRQRIPFRPRPLGLWSTFGIYPYKLYRRVHQPYRYRKAYRLKRNKAYYTLTKAVEAGGFTGLWGANHRLRAHRIFSRVYRSFYGISKQKQVHQQFLRLQKISGGKRNKRNIGLSWFERKLDVTLCRIRLAPSVQFARMLIRRGYIWVNKKQVTTPHFRVAVWDLVEISKTFGAFVRYWVIRQEIKRYAFKNKGLRYRFVFGQRSPLTFGFWTKEPFDLDVPEKDLMKIGMVERLFLSS